MAQEKKGGKHAKPTPRGQKAAIIIAVVLAVIGLLAAGGAYLLHILDNPKDLFLSPQQVAGYTPPVITATPEVTSSLSAEESGEPTPTPEPTPEYQFTQSRVNVLVLGTDSSPERMEQGMNSRTDTMILVSIDFDTNDVDMISLPRDSYVRINGGDQRGKLNAAFVYGGGANKDGYQYAMDTVSWVLGGVTIDYYVGFGMQTVKDVVDAMGGIDYDVDIEFTMNGRKTELGQQHMDGQKVLDYCRFRKTANGDIGRVDRQQRILVAMFQQLKSTGQIKNIPAIYETVMDQIDTNMNLMQIASLAFWARNLDLNGIDRHTLEGNGLMLGNTSYWVLDQEKKKTLVKDIFGMDITIPAGETYSAIKAKAEAVASKVNQVYTLLAPLQTGISNGSITDSSIIAAVNQGQAALITEKEDQLDAAISALSPYANYNATTPTPPPYDPGSGIVGGASGDGFVPWGGDDSLAGGY